VGVDAALDQLERHPLLEAAVDPPRAVDHRHAAAADLVLDPVGADPVARRQLVGEVVGEPGAGVDLARQLGPQLGVERAARAQRVAFLLLGRREQPLDRRASLNSASTSSNRSKRRSRSAIGRP